MEICNVGYFPRELVGKNQTNLQRERGGQGEVWSRIELMISSWALSS